MSAMTITEYAKLAQDQNGTPLEVGEEPALAVQNVTFTGTAGTSNNLNDATRFVRIHVDGIAGVRIGSNVTAVATDPRMGANQTEYFGIPAARERGANFRVSAITRT